MHFANSACTEAVWDCVSERLHEFVCVCVPPLSHKWALNWHKPWDNLTECHPVTPAFLYDCHSSFFRFIVISLHSDSARPFNSPHHSYLGGHKSLLLLLILNGHPSSLLLFFLRLFSYFHLSLAFLYLPLKQEAAKRLAGPLWARPQFVLSQADAALQSKARLWHKRKAQVL